MNPASASRLVRGWVALYTRGLSDDVRTARRDEIESDLWSQREEAGSTGRSATALAGEITARLVLGMAADVAWRLDRGRLADRSIERTATAGTRFVALLAIVGGLAFTVGVARFAVGMLAHPDTPPWQLQLDPVDVTVMTVLGQAGLLSLSVSLGGLGLVLLNRIESPIGLIALLGTAGGIMGMGGALAALFLLPAASAIVVLYLARLHAVHWSLALIHAASAAGFVVPIGAFATNTPVGYAAIFFLAYPMTWIAIGLELLSGFPQARPAAPRS